MWGNPISNKDNNKLLSRFIIQVKTKACDICLWLWCIISSSSQCNNYFQLLLRLPIQLQCRWLCRIQCQFQCSTHIRQLFCNTHRWICPTNRLHCRMSRFQRCGWPLNIWDGDIQHCGCSGWRLCGPGRRYTLKVATMHVAIISDLDYETRRKSFVTFILHSVWGWKLAETKIDLEKIVKHLYNMLLEPLMICPQMDRLQFPVLHISNFPDKTFHYTEVWSG